MSEVNFKSINDDEWYLTFQLPENVVSYLWDCVHRAEEENIDHRRDLAGNISRSLTMTDPDNIMIDTVFSSAFNSDLQQSFIKQIEKDLRKVFPRHKTKGKAMIPKLENFWVNFQKKYEFNPLHDHGGMFSFVIWMKIPYDWKDEKELPWVKDSNGSSAVGNFLFVDKNLENHIFFMNKQIEEYCVIFPSNLRHMVYPFYTSDEERVSISGNIYFEFEQ